METLVTAEKKGIELVLHRKEFLPVNDEYRPFKIVSRRDRWMENYEVPLCVKALSLPRHKRILDVGCGAGFGLVSLSKYCLPVKLVGIDIDPYLLSLAEKKLVEQNVYAELRQEDVRNMPFPDESFDIIVDFGT